MEVIILAGGLGTRLRSVVSEVPKCMAPVAGKPFLWYLLKYLTQYNVDKVILSVGYLREVIFKWIEEVKEELPFAIEYAIEEKPLGTGGGIKLAMEKASDNDIIILNGDTFFDVDLQQLMNFHKNQADSKLTIALKPMKSFDRYGTVTISDMGKVIRFNEKQPCENGLINGGVYVLSNDKDIFSGKPEKFSFETDIMQTCCGEQGIVFAESYNGYFIDIGIPEDYKKADIEFRNIFK